MAIEFNNILFSGYRSPSPKYIIVSIPMYMYRVVTNEFEHGLNFFQKWVLKFKAKPGIKDETIAQYLGLDSKLIAMVTNELISSQLINEHGSLSDKGKEKLNEVEGLMTNSGKDKIGYVFKYVDQDKLYQYYVNNITPADLIEDRKRQYPKIVTGTKGDGEDYTELSFYLEELFKAKSNFSGPTEREVLQLIQNTNKKGIATEQSDAKMEKLSKQLGIRLLNEHPELVWNCTYVYLHQNEDKTFEPDWRVLDPFGFGDNIALKFYLNAPANKNLLEKIDKEFADAKTLGGKILSDYQNQLGKLIEDKLLNDFSFGLNQLDHNLKQYLEMIVKNYILLQNNDFTDLDASVSFSLNMQNILETILKLDKENRKDIYNTMVSQFDNEKIKKQDSLKAIFRAKIFSNDNQIPRPLFNSMSGSLSRANSLISYLAALILSYNFSNKSPLFKILNHRIDLFIEVAQLRNEKGHGQTSKENTLTPMSRQEAEKYYSFIKSFINDYIKHQ